MRCAFFIAGTSCSRECSYCFNTAEAERRHSLALSPKDLSPFLIALKKADYHTLVYTGGEPAETELLPLFLNLSDSLMFYNVLLLSAGAMTQNLAARLAGKVYAYIISLDGCGKTTEAASADIERIRPSGAVISLTYVVTRENIGGIRRAYDFSQKEGLPILFQPCTFSEPDKNTKLSLLYSSAGERSELLAALEPWANKSGMMAYLDFINDYTAGLKPGVKTCSAGEELVVINGQGDVYPCFHALGRKCGNIKKDMADDIMQKLRQTRMFLSGGQCFRDSCISLIINQINREYR